MAQQGIAPKYRGGKEISQNHLQEGEQNHREQDCNEKYGFNFGKYLIDRIDMFYHFRY